MAEATEETATTETAQEQEAAAETTEQVEQQTETTQEATPAAPPPAPTPPPAPPPVQQVQTAAPIDIDAELTAKEALAASLEAGEITYETYAKKTVQHDRRITQAQRLMMQPVQEVQQAIQDQRANQAYFSSWGKGQDPAQLRYAKTVPVARAKQLSEQAMQEALTDPDLGNRAGIDPKTVAYIKWLDLLKAESTKKAAPAAPAKGAAARVSGNATASAGPYQGNKSVKQRLEDGDYDGELKVLSKM